MALILLPLRSTTAAKSRLAEDARAELDPADSAAGILDVAARLTPTDGGRFIDWDGTDHPY